MVTLVEFNAEISRLQKELSDKIARFRADPLPRRGPSTIIRFLGSAEKEARESKISQLISQRGALFPIIPIQDEPMIIGQTKQDNTLRNALLVGGALLLLL